MGKSSKPSYSAGTVSINGNAVASNAKKGNNVISNYSMSDIEKGIYDTAQQELLASLPKINVFSQATQNDINSQLEAYKNKGMQTINDTYNPLLENLKTDIASRFGNLNNSVFFDNLNSIEKNRANAISDLAQDIEAQRSDLFNNELSKRYNYLNFMNDLQNQITDNILNYLGVAQENSSSGTAYNQNLANFQHDKMQDIFNNLIKIANTVLQYKKYM